jgi:alpha-N-acetylglucosamine transferase
MPVDLTKWKLSLGEVIPLQNMERIMSGWKYAPVSDSENGSSTPKRSFGSRAKDCFGSKAFLRTILLLATVLLFANLFAPARDAARRYGWLSQPTNPDGSSKGSEVLKEPLPADGSVKWDDFAYCQYVTNEPYLCNSLMIFASLKALEAKAHRLMLYPEEWIVGDETPPGKLLAKARDEYDVVLQPIHVQRFAGEPTWAESFTKLLAFNQTQYKRVLSLDSDATVLKVCNAISRPGYNNANSFQPMDELFLLPSAPVAMPRAYWLDDILSSQLVLVEPSTFEFNRIQEAFNNRGTTEFDMEIVNNLYGRSCFIIPHRKYDLLTGEFKASEHWKYLGNKEEEWDPDKVLEEAKFLHFSDWPYPKPWIQVHQSQTDSNMPQCHETEGGGLDCRDQKAWLGFYEDFRQRRNDVCGSEFNRLAKREELDGVAMGPRPRYEPVFR